MNKHCLYLNMCNCIDFNEHLYNQCGFIVEHFQLDVESKEYNACTFKLNGLNVICRTAKITPIKTGQFVTLWKRILFGPIKPFDVTDDIDLVVINTLHGLYSGQFIFPRTVLAKHGVLSTKEKEGKRAMRVYPPWDSTGSKQAQNTQIWQLDYFLTIGTDNSFDIVRAKLLYSIV